MGIFSRLFLNLLPGRVRAAMLMEADAARKTTPRERLRQTVADDHAARQEDEIASEMDALKQSIESGIGQVLGDERSRLARQLEDDRRKLKEDMRREYPLSPEERFIRGLSRLEYGADFHSTNPKKPAVSSVWYMPGTLELYVTFFQDGKPGPTYKYWSVSENEAREMYRRASKGIAVWDIFRVRGSKTAHKKNYALV